MEGESIKIFVSPTEADLTNQINKFMENHNVLRQKRHPKGAVLFYLEIGQMSINTLSKNQTTYNSLLKRIYEIEKELEDNINCEELLLESGKVSKGLSKLIPIIGAELGRALTDVETLEGFKELS